MTLKPKSLADVIIKIAEESGIRVSEDQLCPPGIDLGNPKTWMIGDEIASDPIPTEPRRSLR